MREDRALRGGIILVCSMLNLTVDRAVLTVNLFANVFLTPVMTSSQSAPRSSVAQAIALLSHYGFDTKPYTAAERVGHWLEDYEANWIRFAIIEALYQGRYKALSVEHILSMWARRGQPSQHFNGDFERIICRKLPAWYSAASVAAVEIETVAVATVVAQPDDHTLQTERQARRLRCEGIARWRLMATLGSSTYTDAVIAKWKRIATISAEALQEESFLDVPVIYDEGAIAATAAPRLLPPAAAEPQPTEMDIAPEPETASAAAPERVRSASAPSPPALLPTEPTADSRHPTPATLDEPEPEADPTSAATVSASSKTVELPRTEPLPAIARSGIRTFMPALYVSPFFFRLKRFRSLLKALDAVAEVPQSSLTVPAASNPSTTSAPASVYEEEIHPPVAATTPPGAADQTSATTLSPPWSENPSGAPSEPDLQMTLRSGLG